MASRLYVPLSAEARDRLREIAQREYRHPSDQAAYLLQRLFRSPGVSDVLF
jgi:hypothetical protein